MHINWQVKPEIIIALLQKYFKDINRMVGE